MTHNKNKGNIQSKNSNPNQKVVTLTPFVFHFDYSKTNRSQLSLFESQKKLGQLIKRHAKATNNKMSRYNTDFSSFSTSKLVFLFQLKSNKKRLGANRDHF